MLINYKLLPAFQHVAETGSFNVAAERIGRSQAAVSLQIKQLEEQLGVTLFHRTTRRVALTAAGKTLLVSARRALAEIEAGLDCISADAGLLRGKIDLACVPTFAATLLPQIVADFQVAHPGVTIRVRELPAPALLESIAHHEFDFGIVARPRADDNFYFSKILTDDAVALIPTNFRARSKKTVKLTELSQWPLLRLASVTSFQRDIDRALLSLNLHAEFSHEATQVTTLIAMAEASLGVAILPKIAAPKKSHCQLRELRQPKISRDLGVLTVRGQALTPAAQRFCVMMPTFASTQLINGKATTQSTTAS